MGKTSLQPRIYWCKFSCRSRKTPPGTASGRRALFRKSCFPPCTFCGDKGREDNYWKDRKEQKTKGPVLAQLYCNLVLYHPWTSPTWQTAFMLAWHQQDQLLWSGKEMSAPSRQNMGCPFRARLCQVLDRHVWGTGTRRFSSFHILAITQGPFPSMGLLLTCICVHFCTWVTLRDWKGQNIRVFKAEWFANSSWVKNRLFVLMRVPILCYIY